MLYSSSFLSSFFSFISFLQASQGRKTKIQNKQEHTGVKDNESSGKHPVCRGFFYRIPRPDNYRGNDNRCNQKPDKKINKTVRREYDFHHFPGYFPYLTVLPVSAGQQSALSLSASERHCPGFSGYSSGLRRS